MNKAVLISIQPKWCELIASGKKTVEVRKTKPKLETPFKCYIYQTKMRWLYNLLRKAGWDNLADRLLMGLGKVIGEFVCGRIDTIGKRGINNNFDYCYQSLNVFGNDDIEVEITAIQKSCIPKVELNAYGATSMRLFAWRISDLVIYDKPRDLSEFKQVRAIRGYHKKGEQNTEDIDITRLLNSSRVEVKYLTRPPQSWCYVEEVSDEQAD